MAKIRYCEYCGSILLADAQFCENCGRPAAPAARKASGNGNGGQRIKRTPKNGTASREPEAAKKSGAGAGEGRPYVPGEKVRQRRQADLQGQGRPYVPGEKSLERSGRDSYGRSRAGVPPYADRRRREEAERGGPGRPPERYEPRGYQSQDYRFRQQQLDSQWEESWNRMGQEEKRGGSPAQYVLIGAAVLLFAAIIGFAAFWFLGRSAEKGEQERRPPSTDKAQTEQLTKSTETEKQDITILNGQTQAPAQTETQAPVQTEAQTPAQTETQAPVQTETQAPVQTETQAPVQTETQAPIQIQTQAPAGGEGYILAESSQRALTDTDVAGMSYDDMQMAINEIYARHGRKFGSSDIQSYFDGQSWYQGTVEPDQFDESVFSYTEQQNIQFLLQKMGVQ